MEPRDWERGEIRLRSIFEILFIAVVAYVAFQVGPAVKLRIDFLNEMEVAANSPIQMTADQIKMSLLNAAEGYGLNISYENLHVERRFAEQTTVITATYEIYISFWPRFTWVWHVTDQVEGYLL